MNLPFLTFVLCLLLQAQGQDFDTSYNVMAGINPATTLSANPALTRWVNPGAGAVAFVEGSSVTTTTFIGSALPTITAAVIWDDWYTQYNGIYEMSLVTGIISVGYTAPPGNIQTEGCQNNAVDVGCIYAEHLLATVAEGELSGNLIMTQALQIGSYVAVVANYVVIKNLSISVEGPGIPAMYEIQTTSTVTCFDPIAANYTLVDNNGCDLTCEGGPTFTIDLATAIPDVSCSASSSLLVNNNNIGGTTTGTTTTTVDSTTAMNSTSQSNDKTQSNDNPLSVPFPSLLPQLTTVQSTSSSEPEITAFSFSNVETSSTTSPPPAPGPENNGQDGQDTESTSSSINPLNSANLVKVNYIITITCSLSLVLFLY